MKSLLRSTALALVMLPLAAYAGSAQTQTTSARTYGHFVTSAAAISDPVEGAVAAPTVSAQVADDDDDNDARKAYKTIFDDVYERMQMFASPANAAKFKAEWEHKFDKTADLDSEMSARAAITSLVVAGRNFGCPEQFDGRCLYGVAFNAYANMHVLLADPAQRAKFTQDWEHKFDKTTDLDTEAGTDSAIRKMRDSLEQRFDYVTGVSQTKQEHDTMKASFVGIGVPVELGNMGDIKAVAPHELFVHEPSVNSPSFGKLHYGDIIESIDGTPSAQLALKDVFAKFEGKPGTGVTLTVRRPGQSQPVTVTVTRAYTPNPLVTAPQSGDADIGAQVEMQGLETLTIDAAHPMMLHKPGANSPADGKILEGDKVLKVDGKSIDGLTLTQAVDKIRGPMNSSVTMTVERKDAKGVAKTVSVTIKRAPIENSAVHSKALEDKITMIRLDQFEAQSGPRDVAEAISKVVLGAAADALGGSTDATDVALAQQFTALKTSLEKGSHLDQTKLAIVIKAREVYEQKGSGYGVVFDVRSNPGGVVDYVRAITSMMLSQGIIWDTHQRKEGTDQIFIKQDALEPDFEVFADYPEGADRSKMDINEKPRGPLLLPSNMSLVVLINQFSASGSELLAGALQANHRATVIGKTTLGKGVGQSLIELPYGRGLHVTSFEFFPGGMKSDWIGVIPDVDVEPVAGAKSDAQVDAAVVEVKRLNAIQAQRASARAEWLKRHHDYFDVKIKDRANEDSKPLDQQDTDKLQ